ncbi:MAG: aminotransferase class IV [Bacteriovorax sp.]|nr:aminotransferase class IV [Bacteriovorax sp.]
MAKNYQISSLQRGHIVFASFISFNGKLLFLDAHLERLVKGADFLFPKENWIYNIEKIKQYVDEVFKNSADFQNINYYFRLTIFDDCFYLEQRVWEITSDTLKLMYGLKVKTIGLLPSFVKISNYLESDLELMRAKFRGFDDIVFFDNQENITETSTSNIIVVTAQGLIISPAPSSIILAGITGRKLLEKLESHNFKIKVGTVSKSDLEQAQEIWLTNSVKGIRFVEQFEKKFFEKKNSLYIKAIEIFGRYGEQV